MKLSSTAAFLASYAAAPALSHPAPTNEDILPDGAAGGISYSIPLPKVTNDSATSAVCVVPVSGGNISDDSQLSYHNLFPPLDNGPLSCLLGEQLTNLCLPPGTYRPGLPLRSPGNSLFIYDFPFHSLGGIALPRDAAASIQFFDSNGTITAPITESANMAVPDGQGGLRSLSAVAYLTANGGGFTINSTLPTPPLACLFAKVDFQGDVQCFKPGTGQLSARMTNKTNSMRLFGGAFAKGYAGQEQAFHYENDTTEVAQLPGPFNTLMVSPCPPGTVLQADLQQ